MHSNKPQQQGFSLIELSVIMTIIGVTLGSALNLATNITESDKIETTEDRMDVIEEALGRFLIDNQRLPCPASGSVALSASTFGTETTTGSNPATCNNTLFHDIAGTDVIWAGAVPTKTLDIPDYYALDGWNRRITYVVDKRFANGHNDNNTNCNDSTSSECFTFQEADTDSITVRESAAGADITTEAVAVLLSHGENGHGAYIRTGSATRLNFGSTDTDEQENSEYDENGLALTYDNIFVQKATDTTFDDILRYYLKWQLVDLADGVTEAATCAGGQNVHDGGGSDSVCGSAADPNNCRDLGNLIYDVCLSQ